MTIGSIDETAARPRLPRLRGLPWVTWRQHRTALLVTTGLFTAIAVFLTVHGLAMHAGYRALGLDSCGDLHGPACQAPLDVFVHRYGAWPDRFATALMLLPAFLGTFVGAPIVARERDTGTYRFAWTLGRTRLQWLAAKLALPGAALTGLALACGLLAFWWYAPWVPPRGRLGSDMYHVMGTVFAARTLFCFTLAVLLGTLIRRTVPALATATVACLAAIVAPATWLEPLIQKPLDANIDTDSGTATGMTVNQWVVDPAGHRLTSAQTDDLDVQAGPDLVSKHQTFHSWLTQHHYTSWVSYQPDTRFWHFQAVETSAYLAAALLLAATALWWIRRPIH
ncbi:ABC transporter permease subunit [Actinoplanes subtropicus]|uniref:ABC transporter permease subunit n=1 Tax=Actinoplanes subtropicus TaxID=543632 RepID=UPI0004C3A63C|nr:ABC transporter permease subunit [Actinoplanes subtropicus]